MASVPSTSCIGIEIIVSETAVKQCTTFTPGSSGKSPANLSHSIEAEDLADSAKVSCGVTRTRSTFQTPIYNTPIPTMPCYICAMQSQGIEAEGWITATTVKLLPMFFPCCAFPHMLSFSSGTDSLCVLRPTKVCHYLSMFNLRRHRPHG